MVEEAVTVSEGLLRHYPTQTNWVNTLQVINALNEYEPDARVDLYRLMGQTNALTQRPEFVRYIEDLDPRVMANEVQDILASGVTAGVFTTDDPYYVEVKEIADTRASQDRNGIESIVCRWRIRATLSMRWAQATCCIRWVTLPAQKACIARLLKRVRTPTWRNTRIGIAQAEQGNYAAAVDTFGMVDGARSAIARMWATYASSMM